MSKAILLVGFGDLDDMRIEVQRRNPDCQVIVSKTAATGLEGLIVDQVFVQPLYLLPGLEYEKLCRETTFYKGTIKIGKPLLHDETSVMMLSDVLSEMNVGLPILFAGHGTKHLAARLYFELINKIQKRLLFPINYAVLNGYPNFDDALHWIMENRIKHLRLVLLMMSMGKHTHDEIVGGGTNTWRTRLENLGFEVSYVNQSLLDNLKIRELFLTVFSTKGRR